MAGPFDNIYRLFIWWIRPPSPLLLFNNRILYNMKPWQNIEKKWKIMCICGFRNYTPCKKCGKDTKDGICHGCDEKSSECTCWKKKL